MKDAFTRIVIQRLLLLFIASKDSEEAERDQLRYERHKDRERDRRISKAAPDKRLLLFISVWKWILFRI